MQTQKPHTYFLGVGRRYSTICCIILFPESICGTVLGKEGEGRYMNHILNAGNKVNFLSRPTISQPLRDMAGPPDINLHGGILLLPRGGEGGARGVL